MLEGCVDAEVAEVVACREGMALASDLGLQTLRVASDCISAIARKTSMEKVLGGTGQSFWISRHVEEPSQRWSLFTKAEDPMLMLIV